MREILFRGKRTDNGEWVEGYLLETFRPVHKVFIVKFIDISASKSGMTIYDSQIYEVIPKTVGQYTGLTDKNGKKIFEGDIVRNITDYDDTWGDTRTVEDVGAVIWDETNCAWSVINDADITSLCEWTEGDFTVIGNIHDNPELLELPETESEDGDEEA